MVVTTVPPSASDDSPSLEGQVLDGRYRLLHLLGAGGMGEVYAAEHIHIAKRFAVKLLKSSVVSNPEAVARFRQEARAASSIGHRNIIAIEDFGQLPDGRVYMCMELLDGAPLNDLIVGGLAPERLLSIVIQTARALAAAHAKGIVHRDLKPDNIFVTHSNGVDVPKLLDFGIAKVSDPDGQNRITRTGAVFGTPYYMSPEQALGNPVDTRSDIYSLGVIMYEAFSGALPFAGESFLGVLMLHVNNTAEPVETVAARNGRLLPAGIADIVRRCMQKPPDARYPTMEAVANDLLRAYENYTGGRFSELRNTNLGRSIPPGSRPNSSHSMRLGSSATVASSADRSGPSARELNSYTSSSDAAQPSLRRRRWPIVVATLTTLAAAAAAFFLMGGGTPAAVVVPDAARAVVAIDAAPKPVPPDAARTVIAIDAAPKMVRTTVLLASANVARFDIFEAGKKLAAGPDTITITNGAARTFELRAKGYLEQTITIDGSQAKILATFEKKPKAGKRPGGNEPTGNGPPAGNGPSTTPPNDPPKRDCSTYSRACAREYCAANPTKPVCLAL